MGLTLPPVPEMIEVENYRQQAEAVVGRRIAEVEAPDAWFVKGGEPEELEAALPGRTVEAARRIGKLLVLDLDDGGRLGLRFGMTGRLIVDGTASIEKLQYSSMRAEPQWDRFRMVFDDGTDLRIRDPRRLGGVALEPDESALGVDALALSPETLAKALDDSVTALKARLMDQARIAGIGNLIADEVLYRAGLDPARPARSLAPEEVATLAAEVVATIRDMSARGGSHVGEMRAAVAVDGLCPRDGTPLRRRRIGGRTTFDCPHHQT